MVRREVMAILTLASLLFPSTVLTSTPLSLRVQYSGLLKTALMVLVPPSAGINLSKVFTQRRQQFSFWRKAVQAVEMPVL